MPLHFRLVIGQFLTFQFQSENNSLVTIMECMNYHGTNLVIESEKVLTYDTGLARS